MENLGLNWFDLVALGVILLSAVMAFARGLIREVFSIVAFIGGALAAIYFAGDLAPIIAPVIQLSGTLATLAAGLLIFLVVFIVITVLTSVLAKSVHETVEIGAFDRVGGGVFGVLRGVLVIALFVLLMLQSTATPGGGAADQRMPAWIERAATYPMFRQVAVWLQQLPGLEEIQESFPPNNRRGQAESAAVPQAEPAAAPSTPAAEGAAKEK
jgi:membrane protein required for colicin V production